jgi:hypothetical protein
MSDDSRAIDAYRAVASRNAETISDQFGKVNEYKDQLSAIANADSTEEAIKAMGEALNVHGLAQNLLEYGVKQIKGKAKGVIDTAKSGIKSVRQAGHDALDSATKQGEDIVQTRTRQAHDVLNRATRQNEGTDLEPEGQTFTNEAFDPNALDDQPEPSSEAAPASADTTYTVEDAGATPQLEGLTDEQVESLSRFFAGKSVAPDTSLPGDIQDAALNAVGSASERADTMDVLAPLRQAAGLNKSVANEDFQANASEAAGRSTDVSQISAETGVSRTGAQDALNRGASQIQGESLEDGSGRVLGDIGAKNIGSDEAGFVEGGEGLGGKIASTEESLAPEEEIADDAGPEGLLVGGAIAIGGLLASIFGSHKSEAPPPIKPITELVQPVFEPGL